MDVPQAVPRSAVAPWRWRRAGGVVLLGARLGPAVVAFTSRAGGVSEPPFDRLNLGRGLGDREDPVAENHRRLVEALGLDATAVATARQVHGAAVVSATVGGTVPEADALVTTEPGRALLLRFADCVPVFLAGVGARPCAALAHAGWRGLANGVVEAAVAAVCERADTPPAKVLAAIGPAVGPSYQVDEPVMSRLRSRYVWADDCQDDDGVLDMTGAVRRALLEAGLPRSAIVETTERTESPAFFSHRASEGRTGRMGGVICLGGSRAWQ